MGTRGFGGIFIALGYDCLALLLHRILCEARFTLLLACGPGGGPPRREGQPPGLPPPLFYVPNPPDHAAVHRQEDVPREDPVLELARRVHLNDLRASIADVLSNRRTEVTDYYQIAILGYRMIRTGKNSRVEIEDQPELPPAWDHDGHDPAAASRRAIRLGRSLSFRPAVQWRPRGWLLRRLGRLFSHLGLLSSLSSIRNELEVRLGKKMVLFVGHGRFESILPIAITTPLCMYKVPHYPLMV